MSVTTALAAVTGGDEPGGYAIPIDANVKKMIDVLKRGEEIEYGFLGVQVNPEARSDGQGVPVLDVSPDQSQGQLADLPEQGLEALVFLYP